MASWSLWAACGLLLMAAELLLPGIFLVWVGAAALGTGLVLALWPLGFAATALLFILLLAAGVAAGLRAFPPRPARGLNTPGAGLVGRRGTLLENDRARIGDSEWPVRGNEGLPPGAAVEVARVVGVTLVVRPVPGASPVDGAAGDDAASRNPPAA